MSEEQDVQVQQEKIEKEARLGGWVPKEEFRDGDHWVDAETFVRRGKEINPILRKNNESLLKKLEEATAEIAEVKKVAKEFEKFQKETADRKVTELARQIDELKARKKEAISLGDGDTAVAIDDAIDSIKEEQHQTKEQAKEAIKEQKKEETSSTVLDPILVSWMDANTWFTEDKKYSSIANAIGATLSQEHPELHGKAFLDRLDEELADILPIQYQKSNGKNQVEGGAQRTRPSSNKKHSYENLPAEAKAAADRFVKQGLMTKEQYVAEYDWS